MIYLILTTSINNRILTINNNEKRKEQYIEAITHTLSLLPEEIQPIIVENNGKRSTYLDNFLHFNKLVPIVYTNNNEYTFKNKGINEMLDIKEVIKQYYPETNQLKLYFFSESFNILLFDQGLAVLRY